MQSMHIERNMRNTRMNHQNTKKQKKLTKILVVVSLTFLLFMLSSTITPATIDTREQITKRTNELYECGIRITKDNQIVKDKIFYNIPIGDVEYDNLWPAWLLSRFWLTLALPWFWLC